jgi:hypothetical protein
LDRFLVRSWKYGCVSEGMSEGMGGRVCTPPLHCTVPDVQLCAAWVRMRGPTPPFAIPYPLSVLHPCPSSIRTFSQPLFSQAVPKVTKSSPAFPRRVAMKMIQQIYRDKIEADRVDDEANNARQVRRGEEGWGLRGMV